MDFRAAKAGSDILHHIRRAERTAVEGILMGDEMAVAPDAAVAGGVDGYGLADHPAVAGVVANGQILDLDIPSRGHEGCGEESRFFRSVFMQIFGAGAPGDDGGLRILADEADRISMDDHLFMIDTRADFHQGRRFSGRFRKGVNGFLKTCEISAAILCNYNHLDSSPNAFYMKKQLYYT